MSNQPHTHLYTGDVNRAILLKKLTQQWATHFTATLITTILISAPYTTCIKKRQRFIQEFTKDWDFSKLSEFFMFLRSRANIDYKFKCAMLQEAARKEAKEQLPSSSKSIRQRRVSFSDEMKRTYLEDSSSCNTGNSGREPNNGNSGSAGGGSAGGGSAGGSVSGNGNSSQGGGGGSRSSGGSSTASTSASSASSVSTTTTTTTTTAAASNLQSRYNSDNDQLASLLARK